MELSIPLVADGRNPYYEQIYSYIKRELLAGRIRKGEKLPSTRALSLALSISRNTVQTAYDQLTAEGYLIPEPQRGYFAADVQWNYAGENAAAAETFSPDKAPQTEDYAVDFAPFGVDVAHFPFATWRKLAREILVEENREVLAGGDPRGEYGLRASICRYLNSSRGMRAKPEQVVIGAGTAYLLMLLTQLTGSRRIAVEDPTYRHVSRMLKRLSHEILPISTDRQGIRTEELRQTDADMVYVMPAHQFPTGAVLPLNRRQELLRWAEERPGRYLLEDDYDSEFRYRGKPIPSLSALGVSDPIVYLGTFSQTVTPAIRVSFMVLPESLNRDFDEKCGYYSQTVSRIDQEVLAKFMDGGYFERHLNRMRGVYRGKHDALIEALQPFAGTFSVSGERAGLYLRLTSKKGVPESRLIAAAKEAGVKIYGVSEYFLTPRESASVLLGFANLQEAEIRDGVRRLEEALL